MNKASAITNLNDTMITLNNNITTLNTTIISIVDNNQQIKSVMTEQYNNLQNTLMETNMKIQELQQHVNDVVKKNRGPILQNWKT